MDITPDDRLTKLMSNPPTLRMMFTYQVLFDIHQYFALYIFYISDIAI